MKTIKRVYFKDGAGISGTQPDKEYRGVIFVDCIFHPNVRDNVCFLNCSFVRCEGEFGNVIIDLY